MLDRQVVEQIRNAQHGDPFAVLGVHDVPGGWEVRCFQPGAAEVWMVDAGAGVAPLPLKRIHDDGLFEAAVSGSPRPQSYRFRMQWPDGYESVMEDPYRFPPVLGEMDAWLLGEGSHLRPYEILGSHQRVMLGQPGTSFAVWAPNASRVSVVGDFNHWDGRQHGMRLRRECGVWEIFLPGVSTGARYKYEVRSHDGHLLPQKADPYAMQSELRPRTASVVTRPPSVAPVSDERRRANALDAPMSIYEVHLGSWRRNPAEGNRWLNWDELADSLVAYVADMGYTHIELLPVSEHPFDGSWGYQTLGMFSVTSRFGEAAGFRRFVDRAHAAGLGVMVDWVPAHFPEDAHGLSNFDGTKLYEYADPREGYHQDWNTLIYNFGRTEVRNFLVASALFWLERYAVDGLRVDAVASMLYRDYSRQSGEWVPNVHGGRENLEAISFLRRMNEVVGVERPQAVTLAEESTAFPSVSRPVYSGGLGFHYKWNMGWMHDTLKYMARDPIHRKHHHHEMTFGLVYAFNENFVLPLSHDEVVHGKGSLLGKMPGDRWQKFANLRAYYGFMYGHPGKKLMFMGCEFAQEREWNHDQSLDWHLLDDDLHQGMQRLVRDLNRYYRSTPALHKLDFSHEGFGWIDHGDSDRSLLSFVRKDDAGALVLVVCNFTPTVHPGLRVGVPQPGTWTERLNTDSSYYGGSNVGTPFGSATSQPILWNGQAHSIVVDVPPLATVIFEWNNNN